MNNSDESKLEIKKWECPDCGAKCGEVNNSCMFGSYSKDEFYYCEKCRRTYACDENGKKVWIN